jgi:hypothetical protein
MGSLFSSPNSTALNKNSTRIEAPNVSFDQFQSLSDRVSAFDQRYQPKGDYITPLQWQSVVDSIETNTQNINKLKGDYINQTQYNSILNGLTQVQQNVRELQQMYSSPPIGPSSLYYLNSFTLARRIDPQLAIQEPTQSCLSISQRGQYILYAPESKLNQIMSWSASQLYEVLSTNPQEILPYVYKLSNISSSGQVVLLQLQSVSPSGEEIFNTISPNTIEYQTILSILRSNYYSKMLQSCDNSYSVNLPSFLKSARIRSR